MDKRIETKADEFLMWLRRERQMSVPEMEKALDVHGDVLDSWIYMFEKKGLLELIYPANPLEPPYLVITDGK